MNCKGKSAKVRKMRPGKAMHQAMHLVARPHRDELGINPEDKAMDIAQPTSKASDRDSVAKLIQRMLPNGAAVIMVTFSSTRRNKASASQMSIEAREAVRRSIRSRIAGQ